MDPREQQRRTKYLERQDGLRTNAVVLISKARDWCNEKPECKPFMDEMLHSIFFLGKINNPEFTPEKIINVDVKLESLKEVYRRPFEEFSSKLPKRSPFSCVLDMIVLLEGSQNQEQIKQKLKEIVNDEDLQKDFLLSSTLCVTTYQNSKNTYYGVSMSTTGPNPGKIMIAASCLSAWDDCVAGAVMTYYPVKVKKLYFDGTIKLPGKVSCQAYKLSDLTPMDPCRSCGNLFGLNTSVIREWEYGNCAEVESVSNLFKNEAEVKIQAQPTYRPEDRRTAEQSLIDVLQTVLRTAGVKLRKELFSPQNILSIFYQ